MIATLGGQPQILTLALERIYPTDPIDELHTFHFDPHATPRYATALTELGTALQRGPYAQVAWHPHELQRKGQPLADFQHPDAVDMVYDCFHEHLRALKQQGARLHIVLTGGRRLLGTLLFSAIQSLGTRSDRVWHLYSSDQFRQQSNRGTIWYAPERTDVKLINILFTPIGQLFNQTPSQTYDLADRQRQERCAVVWQQLTPRQRQVVLAIRDCDAPNIAQTLAAQLHISPATLSEHTSIILEHCRNAWQIEPGERLRGDWVRHMFRDFNPD